MGNVTLSTNLYLVEEEKLLGTCIFSHAKLKGTTWCFLYVLYGCPEEYVQLGYLPKGQKKIKVQNCAPVKSEHGTHHFDNTAPFRHSGQI